MKENPTLKKKKKKKKKKNLDHKNDDKNIIIYRKDIQDIAKHACYCCKTLCFALQIHLIFKFYFNKLPNDF
jgi:hypothetical protein